MGTITEIHDYLRLLYARVGEPRCPDHDVPLAAQTVSQMVDNVLAQPEGLRLMLLAPIIKERKGEHTKTENLASRGYIRARIDGEVAISDPPKLELQKKHTIEVVMTASRSATIWRNVWPSRSKPRWSSPAVPPSWPIWMMKAEELLFSANFACPICGYSMRELEPRLFSFNNRRAPARPATASACSNISTPIAWCKIRSCRWRAAPSAAGIGVTSTTSRC